MKKPDELLLFQKLYKENKKEPLQRKSAGDIVDEINMNEKRAYYLLADKWYKFWNYGVSCFAGWFEDDKLTPKILKEYGIKETKQ